MRLLFTFRLQLQFQFESKTVLFDLLVTVTDEVFANKDRKPYDKVRWYTGSSCLTFRAVDAAQAAVIFKAGGKIKFCGFANGCTRKRRATDDFAGHEGGNCGLVPKETITP